jgi:hypothetical protein
MSKNRAWAEAIAEAGGLRMTAERAAEVGDEAMRIRAGVAKVSEAHFGFYDEPIQFLSALEACAEDEA